MDLKFVAICKIIVHDKLYLGGGALGHTPSHLLTHPYSKKKNKINKIK